MNVRASFPRDVVEFPTAETATDATRGQPLAARVLERKDELEVAHADLGPHDVIERRAIETALATVYALITGNLAHPSDVVARDLNCCSNATSTSRRSSLADDVGLVARHRDDALREWRRRLSRQVHREDASGAWIVVHVDFPAVHARAAVADGKPEAQSRSVGASLFERTE